MLEQTNLLDKIQEYRAVQPDDLNMTATKRNVIDLIYAYEVEVHRAGGKVQPKVTPSYSIMPPSFGNGFYSSTESSALDNLEKHEMVELFFNKITLGLNSIDCVLDADRKGRRRKMFVMRYIQSKSRQQIMEELAIEKTAYHEDMNMAVTQFAYELGLHVKLKF
ncbi:transcriptional activator [Brochothrix phage NF5]|uniref:transcriptional activator n=1 Tax=Brochothrix phage NF5 TaxID=764561 RepID=UPI0001D9ACC0|nr:transcriptional activator [Brochothrix phage NF5]ADH03075.1 gp53 [Brochothrix phage NF5]